MALEFSHEKRSSFRALKRKASGPINDNQDDKNYPPLVSHGILDFDFIQLCAIVQLDSDGISDRPFFRVMVLGAEALVFNTANLGTEFVNARISSCLVGTLKWSASCR